MADEYCLQADKPGSWAEVYQSHTYCANLPSSEDWQVLQGTEALDEHDEEEHESSELPGLSDDTPCYHHVNDHLDA